MPSTWKLYSTQVLGYVAPISEINDIYVSAHKVQEFLDKGKTVNQVFLSWNAGENAKKCGSGKNKYGVKYNSCEYVKKGLIAYNSL